MLLFVGQRASHSSLAVKNRFILGEDEEFIAILVKILSRHDYLYDAAQRIILGLVSSSRKFF